MLSACSARVRGGGCKSPTSSFAEHWCVFSSLSAVCFVLARRDAADPAERGWVWYDVATGILVAVFVVVTVLVTLLDGPGGFMERIFLIAGWSWIALLAIRLMSKKA
jgi:hypothetical protein